MDKPPDNPYASPVTEEPALEPSALTTWQRQILVFYWLHRERLPSAGQVFLRTQSRWPRLVAFFGSIGFAFLVFTTSPNEGGPMFCAVFALGAVLGTVSRDFSAARGFVRSWPLLRAILDWKEIESRLDER